MELCSSEDATVRTAAFWYLCDNLPSKYSDYNPSNFGHATFVPAENNNGNHLGKLGDVTTVCFFSPSALLMILPGILGDTMESAWFFCRSGKISKSSYQRVGHTATSSHSDAPFSLRENTTPE